MHQWLTAHASLCTGVYPLQKNRNTSANNLLFNATYACRLGPPLCFNLLKLIHEADAADKQNGPRTFFMQTSFGAMDKVELFEIGARPSRFTGVWLLLSPLSSAWVRILEPIPSPSVKTYSCALLFVGDWFSDYAPLLIVILCGCTALNLGSALLSCFGSCFSCLRFPSFSFDDDFSDGRIDMGSQILCRERDALASGAPLGAHLQLLSGATSDGEENQRKQASIRMPLGSSLGTASSSSKWRQMLDDGL